MTHQSKIDKHSISHETCKYLFYNSNIHTEGNKQKQYFLILHYHLHFTRKLTFNIHLSVTSLRLRCNFTFISFCQSVEECHQKACELQLRTCNFLRKPYNCIKCQFSIKLSAKLYNYIVYKYIAKQTLKLGTYLTLILKLGTRILLIDFNSDSFACV